MIKFNDNNDWLNNRIAHIPHSYFVPEYFNGNGVCIDIGANVGAFAIYYNNKFNKIICYEPAKYTNDECIKNTKHLKNVEVHKYAITNISGVDVKLKSHKVINFSGNASIIDSVEWNDDENYEYVQTKSFVDIINECDIKGKKNYVKIDTEGSEYSILMNQDLSMIDVLAVEIHLQLGIEKITELRNYLDKFFNILKSSGGKNFHYETVYLNKRFDIDKFIK
jgi:FkbM family methyltransferase